MSVWGLRLVNNDNNEKVQAVVFSLSIEAEELQRWYSGSAQDVLVYSNTGQRVRFPASALRPFISRQGVHGRFRIWFDAGYKLQGLERID